MLMGAAGDGCAADSTSPAPDVAGTWGVTYDDMIDVEATIGGAVYDSQVGAAGGAFTITGSNGTPYTFDLDCSRPDVVCPSKAWPNEVVVDQDNVMYPHQMIVNLPQAQCQGSLVQPAADACGVGTNNPNCDLVCNGDVDVASAQAFGVIGEAGDSFRLYLGGGIVTNGVNCAMLGYSVADADLVTSGKGSNWDASAMQSGLVTIGYSGACLFAGTAPDGDTQALLAAAELKFTTGFTGTKQ
ncbi:MAG TPA: hypothetical protein VGL61_26310 [Kofleriaceae bacterium]|jgi:hypothetical protein